ncbi:MAG: Ig-like domain-containing protein [Verrucomicrobiales bacterium]|nr:Ig-like domain-containing protein [Verrucomicrobiales bacterium]
MPRPYLQLLATSLALTILLSCKPSSQQDQAPISQKTATTARIFPQVDTLPANHLKFYIEFPQPMARGDIFKHFSLIETDSRKAVPEPFREIELWDESTQRLTLWFHPGRQKPGVNLNLEIGPILESGENYTLIISGKWQNEAGQLGENITKNFRADPIDAQQPQPKRWKHSIPSAGSTQPFTITFLEPLDYALILRSIRLTAPGNPTVKILHNDLSISFTPDTPWQTGTITLHIDTKLEDLAGNSIARPFNLDLQASPQDPVPTTLTRKFHIQ